MNVFLSPFFGVGYQAFNNSGVPLAGGYIYTYLAGTTTPATTYTTASALVANANPIVLDSGGRTPQAIWLDATKSYKFAFTDSVGNPVGYTVDNITGLNNTATVNTGSMSKENFSGTGAQVAYTLAYYPGDVGQALEVYISGVYQQTGSWTVSGQVLTFSTAPPLGTNNIEVVNIGIATLSGIASSLVTYLPAGTNAVATTVQAKLRESVSVLDFGADPTGVADSAAAIQNAINAVSLAGGGTVYVPAGIYKITTTIYLSKTMSGSYYNPVQLVGAGRMSGNKTGGTILNHTGSGVAVWVGDYLNDSTSQPYNSYYFSVRDLSVIGNASTTIGFRFRQCYQLRLDNVTFNGTNGSSCTGMVFEACAEGLFNLLDIQFAGTTAGTKCINVTQSCNTALPLTASSQGLASTSSTFLGGYFHYAYQGASVYGNSVTFQNSKWETLVYGVEDASGGYQNTYIQNYWENVQGYGISVYSSDAANPAGNINIIGGFANRYDQAGSDMTGYTGANAFLKLYNCNNVKMQGTQISQAVSLYSSVYDAGGPTGPNQNIYVESNAGSLTPFATRYTAAGATGITGATLATTSGSPIVLVTKAAHGMVKGQVLDLSGFNSGTLGLTVNRPYCVVSSVVNSSSFNITYPINASTTATNNSGTIKYYTGGKLTNSGLPTSTILTDCEYQTYVFQATQASAGTNVAMSCNGTPFVTIPYDYYIKSYNMTVDNPNVSSVSTYAYINSKDTVASRYDTVTNLLSADISGIGDYYTNGLTNIKQQAGQGLTVTLYDNGGSGATYPRHFTVEVVIANTLKAPT